MSAEYLELVTSFASLRAGDLCLVKNCARCSKAHRGILTIRDNHIVYAGRTEEGWRYAPTAPCCYSWSAVGHSTVAERRLYRVIIPPVEETRETAQPKQLERVR